MPIPELPERELQLILQANTALQSFLEAMNRDEIFAVKRKLWSEVRQALDSIEKISPALKALFVKDNHLHLH